MVYKPPVSPAANTRPDDKFLAAQQEKLNLAAAKEKFKTETNKKIASNKEKITEYTDTISRYTKSGLQREAEYMAYYQKLINENPNASTKDKAGWVAAYKTASDNWKSWKSKIDSLVTKKSSLVKENEKLRNSLKAGYKPPSAPPAPPAPPPAPPAETLVYKYNIPMLRSAYHSPFGIQANSTSDSKSVAAPEFTNAREAWKGVTPSKGTIQMSKVFAANAMKPKSTKGLIRSEQPYGFRFMYNPTDVSMAWGIVDAFSPEYVQSGMDGMSGIAVGLMKGTISFSLLLNRIGESNVLDSEGYYQGVFADIGIDNLNDSTAYIAGRYGINSGLSAPQNYGQVSSPWGMAGEPDREERKMIYDRGTMYDLEYLFRAMGGYYADYKSGLNGTTADRGWLQPIPMELHLGAGLRYLVRVSSLDVKHLMFNERMVPTLSTVNLVCTRYYDSPDAFDTTFYEPESKPTTTPTAIK